MKKLLTLLWMAFAMTIGFAVGVIVHPFLIGYSAGADAIENLANDLANKKRERKRGSQL